MTRLADVSLARSQEDLVSNWEPARSLVEDVISGAQMAQLPSSYDCRTPAPLPPAGEGLVRSQPALLCYWLSPLFSEGPGPGCTFG